MKIYATYDEAGKIDALVIPSDEMGGSEIELVPEPGQYAGEFDVKDTGDRRRDALLTDLYQNHRVERSVTSVGKSSTSARMVRKDRKA